MKAVLTSFVFLVFVVLVISVDHLIDALFAHNYAKVVIYGLLSLLLLIAFLLLVL